MATPKRNELRQIRAGLGLTQTQMAEKMGVKAQSTYSGWESNPDKQSEAVLQKAWAIWKEMMGVDYPMHPHRVEEPAPPHYVTSALPPKPTARDLADADRYLEELAIPANLDRQERFEWLQWFAEAIAEKRALNVPEAEIEERIRRLVALARRHRQRLKGGRSPE